MIRIEKRPEVGADVVEFCRTMARRRLERIKERVEFEPEYARDAIMAREKNRMAAMVGWIKSPDQIRDAIRRQRGYTSFSVFEHRDTTWLIAKTKEIRLMTEEYLPLFWSLGELKIWLPMEHLCNDEIGMIHFVPEADPTVVYRTPHHYASVPPSDLYHSRHATDLSRKPSTCWGNFVGLIRSAAADGDVPGLLKLCMLFVQVYNSQSPFARPGTREMPHAKRV